MTGVTEEAGSAAESIRVAFFRHARDVQPRARTYAWEELARLLTTHSERGKKDGPLWSPAVYREGATRGKAGVREVTALALDYDHGEPPWTILEPFAYMVHSTYRHTAEAPRLRVVVRLTRPVPAAEWPETWARAQVYFGSVADEQCKDASRAYYLPACPAGAPRVAKIHQGRALDPEELLPLALRPPQRTGPAEGARVAPTTSYALAGLEAEAGEVARTQAGERNARLNRAAYSLGQLVAAGALTRVGVEAALEDAAAACGLEHDDGVAAVRRTIRSGLDAGEREPRTVPDRRPPARLEGSREAVDDQDADMEPAVPGSGPPLLQALTAAQVFPETAPTIPWLVRDPEPGALGEQGLLAEQNVFVLSADSGLGKTWVLADLVIALAGALPLFGHFATPRACRVMLVDEESSLWLVQDRWPRLLRGRGIEKAAFLEAIWPNVRLYVDSGFSFENDRALGALRREVESFRPDLILFDALSRVHRRSENDNSAMAALFEERIKPFKREYGLALGFAHHTRKPSKDGSNDAGAMMRGASDIKAQLDQHWFLRGKANLPKLIFEHDKCRVAPAVAPFTLLRESTEEGGVVLHRSDEAAAAGTAVELAEDVVLKFLLTQGPSPRTAVLEHAKARKVGTRTAEKALKQLYEDDRVARTKEGKETLYMVVEDDL